jgi:hypothetical protein
MDAEQCDPQVLMVELLGAQTRVQLLRYSGTLCISACASSSLSVAGRQ